jgi:hypothetical protein
MALMMRALLKDKSAHVLSKKFFSLLHSQEMGVLQV